MYMDLDLHFCWHQMQVKVELVTLQRFMLRAVARGEIINGRKMSSPLSFDETTLVCLIYRQGGGKMSPLLYVYNFQSLNFNFQIFILKKLQFLAHFCF